MNVRPYYNRYNAFRMHHPEIWFLKLEARFYLQGITSQLDKYYFALSELPENKAFEVIDLLKAVPEENPYDQLKHGVITRLTEIRRARIRHELSYYRLADLPPSELLMRMREVAEDLLDEGELCQTWIKRLPGKTRHILGVIGQDTPLDKLADLADLVHEESEAPAAPAPEHQISQLRVAKAKRAIDMVLDEIRRTMDKLNTLLEQPPSDRSQLK
ncbi:unnamed protein product [Mesocestoides corti]|uniref:DUF7041 domain-containing protein n=2 Tax=Mesocestoides corti TaxID=53468 RepID=A0A0R3U4I7_MESCO|nr:unnamed protein product [Mesocestoides corti]